MGQLFGFSSFAKSNNVLKIAIILKNNNVVPYTSDRYVRFYKQGINTATYYGQSLGLSVESKYWVMADISRFSSQVKEINEWEPDLIIGPNYSNSFLLLRDYFKDILVLSAYANDQSIASLPSNFHTLNPLNETYAQAFTNYISKKHPHSGVVVIVDESCKSCYSLSKKFAESYKSACPKNTIKVLSLEKNDLENTIQPRVFEEAYENKIVLMLTTTDDAITLIPMLSEYAGKPLTFFGGDSWGSSIDSKLGQIKTREGYQTIHITPRSIKLNSAELNLFIKNHKDIYKQQALDNVTYAVFSTVNSVFVSLENCSFKDKENMKSRVLRCYLSQLSINPSIFKSNLFAVEKVELNGTTYIDTISSDKKYYCDGKINV